MVMFALMEILQQMFKRLHVVLYVRLDIQINILLEGNRRQKRSTLETTTKQIRANILNDKEKGQLQFIQRAHNRHL